MQSASTPLEVDVADMDRYRYQVGAKNPQYVSLDTNIKVIEDAAALLDSEESICAGTQKVINDDDD